MPGHAWQGAWAVLGVRCRGGCVLGGPRLIALPLPSLCTAGEGGDTAPQDVSAALTVCEPTGGRRRCSLAEETLLRSFANASTARRTAPP